MLVLRTVGVGQIGYYLPGPEPGRWLGTGCPRLGLDRNVSGPALAAVLAGRHPEGTPLVRQMGTRRRCGFDAILAAPKSVSLLAAMAEADPRHRIESAHDRAVHSALAYLERRATWTRRRGEQIATDGLTAASFTHRWSAAHDPHLHTHLVVANLVRGDDGVWSTIDSRALYRHARAAGAIYQASLRHGLADRGLRFEWDVRPSGLADIAGVARTTIEACSRRQRQVIDEVESGTAGRRGRATAGGRTRGGGARSEAAWDVEATRTGFDRTSAAALVAVSGRPQRPISAGPPARTTIEALLAGRHSRFERQDVVHAVARLTVTGGSGPQIERWADDFLTAAVAVDRRTWTTPGLRRIEERTVAMATRTGSPKAGVARSSTVEALLAQRDHLTDADRVTVRRLTTGGAPVELLAAGNLVSQSWVLDAARAGWEASGHRVAVLSPTDRGVARWEALTGIGRPPPAPARPTVVVVDGVDRWPTGSLYNVLADGEARNAKVVLVDGGTSPARRRPLSPVVETLRRGLPVIDRGWPAPDPARLPVAGPVVRAGRDGAVAVVPDGAAAMSRLVADWAEARAQPSAPTMVALGPEEAVFLNTAARARLRADGRLTGPAIEAGGRQYQTGDELRALRRDSRLGSVPGGTVGVVKSVDESQQRLVVKWRPDAEVTLTAKQLAGAPLTHAYATTPAYLRGTTAGPAWCLGDPRSVGSALTPDVVVQVVAPLSPVEIGLAAEPLAKLCPERDDAPGERRAELDAAIDWRQRALGVAAEVLPSCAVVEALGPRPSSPAERQAWRRAARAIEAYRDRWSIPDQRVDLASVARSPDRSGRQLADALGVITGCRRLEQSRDRDHALTR